ncbi:MAG: Fe-S-containing hydro-lyase [Candidatus Latescibacterota bacterium]
MGEGGEKGKLSVRQLTTPLSEATVRSLHAGDSVTLSGTLYTARDAAHQRLVALLERGEDLPFDPEGQVIYYVGPSPAPPGKVIGSAGPTSSYRMDPYTIPLLARGLKGMIGKGERGEEVAAGLQAHAAVYFAATGGAGALLARCIRSSEIVAYEDLGPEAIRRLVVADFPAVVAQDCHGGNAYASEKREPPKSET